MAHLKPHLLTESEIRRRQDCADENAKLADCWNAEQVVILSFDWPGRYMRSGYTLYPTLRLDIMSPAEKPVWGSRVSDKQPWYMKVDAFETFDLYSDDAKAKAQGMFDELAAEYATMCVVAHDVRESAQALETFGVRLPPKAVVVDLIKVLEHQTRDEGIPEQLSAYTDENVAVRNGRYDRRAGTTAGRLGLPCVRLLEVVGPAAESRRSDFKKAERGDAALKRIARRARLKG